MGADESKDILCNRCGRSCKSDIGNFEGLINATASGGYGATFPPDTEQWTFSLCESCLGWLIMSFKTFPAASSYMGDGEGGPWEPAVKALMKGDASDLPTWQLPVYQRALAPLDHTNPDPNDPALVTLRMWEEWESRREQEEKAQRTLLEIELYLRGRGMDGDEKRPLRERVEEFLDHRASGADVSALALGVCKAFDEYLRLKRDPNSRIGDVGVAWSALEFALGKIHDATKPEKRIVLPSREHVMKLAIEHSDSLSRKRDDE